MDKGQFFYHNLNFDEYKEFIDGKWTSLGLKDQCIREFRTELLSADEFQESDLISRALWTRDNRKFMELINLGLPLNYAYFEEYSANKLKRREYLPSFLHQAIEKGDVERVQLLLSAGAKPTIDALDPFNDTFQYCIFAKKPDPRIFASVLSYIDEPIDSHWVFDILTLMRLNNYKFAEPFMALLMEKLEAQGLDPKIYAKENNHEYLLHFKKGGLDSVEHNFIRNLMNEAEVVHKIS